MSARRGVSSGKKMHKGNMTADTLQTWSQVVATIGLLLTGLGGFGSYYFGRKAESAQRQELRTHLVTLEERLKPFQELAHAARPELDQDAALDGLRREIQQLREIAGKHEFTPLAPKLREEFVRRILEFSPSFLNEGVSVQITHETWSPRVTKQYLAQLAEMLREGGLEVQGPKQITYFLVTPASPIEWGYNEKDVPRVEVLYKSLLTIIRPNSKWTKASHQPLGSIRIHFGGTVVFEPGGIVKVL